MKNRLGGTFLLLCFCHAEQLPTIQLKHVPGIRVVLQAMELKKGVLLTFQCNRARHKAWVEFEGVRERGILILTWARYMQQFGSDRLWFVRKVWQASGTDRVLCRAA